MPTTNNDKLAIIEWDNIWEPGIPLSPGSFGQDDKQQLIWGYPGISWGEIVVAPFTPFITVQSSDVVSILKLVESQFQLLLQLIGCNNVYPSAIPPLLFWESYYDILELPKKNTNSELELWAIERENINHPIMGGAVHYPQEHRIRINGYAWKTNFIDSRDYIQKQTEDLVRLLELNKSFGLQGNAEITNVEASFDFDEFGEVYLYQSVINVMLEYVIRETNPRNIVN